MAHWIVRINRPQKATFITIPKIWAEMNLAASDRYVILKDTGNGKLEVVSERQWYEENIRKHPTHGNN